MQEYTKGSGTTTLIISNYEMEDIIKAVKSLEDSGLLLKAVSKTIKNEAKEQIGGFLSVLHGTLGASLLGDILAGKGINRTGEGIARANYGNKKGQRAIAESQGPGIVKVGHKSKMDFECRLIL